MAHAPPRRPMSKADAPTCTYGSYPPRLGKGAKNPEALKRIPDGADSRPAAPEGDPSLSKAVVRAASHLKHARASESVRGNKAHVTARQAFALKLEEVAERVRLKSFPKFQVSRGIKPVKARRGVRFLGHAVDRRITGVIVSEMKLEPFVVRTQSCDGSFQVAV